MQLLDLRSSWRSAAEEWTREAFALRAHVVRIIVLSMAADLGCQTVRSPTIQFQLISGDCCVALRSVVIEKTICEVVLLLALLTLERIFVEIEAICLVSGTCWAGLPWILRRIPTAIAGILATIRSCEMLFRVAEGTRCLHPSLVLRLQFDATVLF